MPNYCLNEVDISGSEEDVKRFIDLVTEEFDYNRVIPMPEELNNTESPTKILTQAEYHEQEKHNKKIDDGEEGIHGYGITKEMQQDYIARFGYDNSYDWCINNWGVKCNSFSLSGSIDFDYSDRHASWRFYSPWDSPEPVCKKLRELFPDLGICWFYKEPSLELAGWL